MSKHEKGQDGLTEQQRLFVQAFLRDPSPKRAAEAAKYSKRSAGPQGSRLLANANVLAAIEEGQKQRDARLERSGDDVIKRLWSLAELDWSEALAEAKLADLIKILDLLGKHHGVFADKLADAVKEAAGKLSVRIVEKRRDG